MDHASFEPFERRADTVHGEPDEVWLDPARCAIDDFRRLVARETRAADVPLADAVVANVPVYDGERVRAALPVGARDYMAEWHRVFADGAGIVAIRGAYADTALVDAVTTVLGALIDAERDSSPVVGAGDHFAAAGANSRLWNAHEKLCVAAPELFARYNANPLVPLASRAWLGPLYQITTQVNVVHPGGRAQTCHRDYHMGFQTPEALVDYPASVHRLSATLTLQGAVAHSDMPIESGPTKLLPYSQTYVPGYLAAHLEPFREHFETHHVQVPLAKGDAMFFNPAVFHAAGDNRTSDVERFANLMQIGSAYGRSIEIVDRHRMSLALYPTLQRLARAGTLDADELEHVVAACAEGYPFPANLDIDSPLSGMAPPSQQDVLRQALAEGWPAARLQEALDERRARKRSH